MSLPVPLVTPQVSFTGPFSFTRVETSLVSPLRYSLSFSLSSPCGDPHHWISKTPGRESEWDKVEVRDVVRRRGRTVEKGEGDVDVQRDRRVRDEGDPSE